MVTVIKRISVSPASLRQHRQAWVSTGRKELELWETEHTETASMPPLRLHTSLLQSFSQPSLHLARIQLKPIVADTLTPNFK